MIAHTLYGIIVMLASLLTLIFVTNFQAYVHSLRIGLLPYHWYVAASVIFLFFALLSGRFQRLPRTNLIIIGWFVALLFLLSCSLIFVSNTPSSLRAFNSIAMFSSLAISFTLLVSEPKITNSCGRAVAIAVIVLAVISFIEFFNPNFNAIDDVMFESKGTEGLIQRVGGLFENPNANGYALALGMFVGQYFVPLKLRFVFAILVGAAILTTVSRSAMLLWSIIVFVSFWIGTYSKGRVLSKLIAIILIGVLTTLLITGQIPLLIESFGLESYFSPQMIDRLSGSFFIQEDASTDARVGIVSQELERFASNPLFGSGLGSSGSADLGTHNMALAMAVELGVFGLILYFALLAIPVAVKSVHGTLFVVFYFFANLFTHTSFEKPIFAILIPLSILAFTQKVNHTKRRKKRRRRTSSEYLA